MGALAIPLIEAAAVRVLTALGVGAVAGGAASELGKPAPVAVRERQEVADKARTSAIACTPAQTGAKQKCQLCPPDTGAPFNRLTAGWSEASIEYQMRIGGMPVGPGFITEWVFNGVTFDGFDSSRCLLKEAKGRYDQFFNQYRQIQPWWREGELAVFNEAMRQGAAARPRPPVQLKWFFMEPISFRYFSTVIRAAYPDIEVIFQP